MTLWVPRRAQESQGCGQRLTPRGHTDTSRWNRKGLPAASCSVPRDADDDSCCCLVTESRLTLVTLGTVAHPAPVSMGFSRPEDWSGLPFLSPGGLPSSGIKPQSPELQEDSLMLSYQGSPDGNRAQERQKLVPWKCFHNGKQWPWH